MTTIRTLRRTAAATMLTALAGMSALEASALTQNTPAPESTTVSILGLREGSRGPGVRVVEQRLLSFGYVISGGADNVFGSSTTLVLETFQQQNGLNPTGVVTENTAKYLGWPSGRVSTGPAAENATAAPSAGGNGGAPATNDPNTQNDRATRIVGMKRGASGPKVKQVQQALIGLGLYLNGGADGVFGPSTEHAVKLVQRVNGLPESGVVTAEVAAILGLTGSASSPETPAPASPSAPQLRYGSRGAAVKRVQQQLIAAGISLYGGADGIFGLHTQRAVRQFQQAKGLKVTGVVDAATAKALNGGSTSSGGSAPAKPPAVRVVGLRLGSTGPGVVKVQNAIMATGMYLRGGADGIFGSATYRAVAAYQRVNGLAQTGIVDAQTARLMGLVGGNTTPGASTGGNTAAGFAVYDERGPRVVALQKALMRAGITVPGGADGIFGSQTLGAVRRFQQARGLPATGKVDAATAKALGLTAAEKAPKPAPAPVRLQARPIAGGSCWYADTWQANRGGGRVHLGVDIGAPEGTPLRAVVSGRITYVVHDQPGSLAGNGLKITTADGTYFFYAHLSGFAKGIKPGVSVKAGQVIGYVGSTGNAGIAHLHLEIHPGGDSAINPYPIIKAFGAC